MLIKIWIYQTFRFHDFKEAFIGIFISLYYIIQQLFFD